jgi:hypothetical protein
MQVKLVPNGSNDVVTPLGIPSYQNLGTGTRSGRAIVFELEILQTPVDKISVEIKGQGGVLLQKDVDAATRAVGTHRFEWDGLDGRGVLDTKALKSSITVMFKSVRKGVPKEQAVTLRGVAAGPPWVDAVVDTMRKTVDVELRVDIQDGGAARVGELPPKEVQKGPTWKALPPAQRAAHTRVRSFVRLRADALASLQRHWSRSITTPEGSYRVNVNAIQASSDAMDDIAIVYHTNEEWLRSSNPGSVRGVYSFFGSVVPERVAYNVGWIRFGSRWRYVSAIDADEEFAATAAHEIGHEILSAYGGDSYSYGHRGSSTVITQKVKTIADGGESFPTAGEIDLMKYYNGAASVGHYSRVIASEQDAQSFLYLARIRLSK